MNPEKIVVLGAGGCAREVAWTIRESLSRHYEFAGYIVTDVERLGPHDSSGEVLGDLEWLEDHLESVSALAVGIGTPSIRRKVVNEVLNRFPNIAWPTIIHPMARFDQSSARIDRGVVICAGVTATVNIQIEEFAMVHYGSTIGHESRIGAFSVVNPGANISGGVDVGMAVLVGAGSVIRQYHSVGDHATVGAGAVVTKNVPSGQIWVGVPAAPMPDR